MTMRMAVRAGADSGWWIGLGVVVPLAVALLAAAASSEIGQALLGLASFMCAPCVDPGNGIGTAAAAAGAAAAGTAAGGAAAGGGGADGSTDRAGGDPRTPGRGRDPRIPDPTDDVGDQTPWPTLPPRPPDAWYEHPKAVEASDRLQKWTEDWVEYLFDPDRRWLLDEKGTAPASLS